MDSLDGRSEKDWLASPFENRAWSRKYLLWSHPVPHNYSRNVLQEANDPGVSFCEVSAEAGNVLTLWCRRGAAERLERSFRLQLFEYQPAIIGRQSEGRPEYLDESYHSTAIVPTTGQSILYHGGDGEDAIVSRAHFMLQKYAGGVLFVNGVPRQGGGIRPPMNSTKLVQPAERFFEPAEEYFIQSSRAITIELPNQVRVKLTAR